MENINYTQESNLLGDYFFKISYPKQNYKKSIEYQKWKKIVIDKIGNNGKEIICNKDNTIIYKIYNDNDDIITCPTCNSYFYNCNFCNITQTEECHICCVRSFLKYEFNNYCKTSHLFGDRDEKKKFKKLLIYQFIPICSSFLFILVIHSLFFMSLGKKNIPYHESGEGENKKDCFFTINFLFLLFYSLLMSIIFALFFVFVFLLFFIVSLPFKLYFVKLYIKMLDFQLR